MASLYVAVQYEPKVGCSARKESGISRSRGEEKKKGNHKGHEETQSSQSQIWRALRASSSPHQKPRQNEMSFVSLGVLCGFPSFSSPRFYPARHGTVSFVSITFGRTK